MIAGLVMALAAVVDDATSAVDNSLRSMATAEDALRFRR